MFYRWPALSPWGRFWFGLFGLFFVAKWATWQHAGVRSSLPRHLGYLFAWPGMNAREFLDPSRTVDRPHAIEWIAAFAKIAFGLVLALVIAPLLADAGAHRLATAWVGLSGIGFAVFLGAFHVASVAWRAAGVDAPVQWRWPILAASPSDFWSRRWNRAFRRLGHDYVFRPLAPRIGVGPSMTAVFLCSGLLHELVVSAPTGGGWGLPTAYFLLQALSIAVEKSRPGRRLGLDRRPAGWCFGFLTVAIGAGFLLFHPRFMDVVVLPGLDALRALMG
jgi:alginate O-acetyltransferase complex protein AlgI